MNLNNIIRVKLLLSLLIFFHTINLHMASAEVVRLLRGVNNFSHGWLFIDAAGNCVVATVRHAIQDKGDKNLYLPLVLDADNFQNQTYLPFIPDKKLDIVFLLVKGEVLNKGCTSSRLSRIPRSIPPDNIFLYTSSGNGDDDTYIQIPLQKYANSGYKQHTPITSFVPKKAIDELSKGMSGSVIVDLDGRPLAMLYEVCKPPACRENVANSYPINLIAEQIHKANAYWSKTLNKSSLINDAQITIRMGRLINPKNGPLQLLEKNGIFKIMPKNNSIKLIYRLKKNVKNIAGLRIKNTFPREVRNLKKLYIHSVGDVQSTNFEYWKSCLPSPDQSYIFDCAFAKTNIGAIKLIFEFSHSQTPYSFGEISLYQ